MQVGFSDADGGFRVTDMYSISDRHISVYYYYSFIMFTQLED